MIEKEKMRKFIFEEFMKRDPDQITFEKPDSADIEIDTSNENPNVIVKRILTILNT